METRRVINQSKQITSNSVPASAYRQSMSFDRSKPSRSATPPYQHRQPPAPPRPSPHPALHPIHTRPNPTPTERSNPSFQPEVVVALSVHPSIQPTSPSPLTADTTRPVHDSATSIPPYIYLPSLIPITNDARPARFHSNNINCASCSLRCMQGNRLLSSLVYSIETYLCSCRSIGRRLITVPYTYRTVS